MDYKNFNGKHTCKFKLIEWEVFQVEFMWFYLGVVKKN